MTLHGTTAAGLVSEVDSDDAQLWDYGVLNLPKPYWAPNSRTAVASWHARQFPGHVSTYLMLANTDGSFAAHEVRLLPGRRCSE